MHRLLRVSTLPNRDRCWRRRLFTSHLSDSTFQHETQFKFVDATNAPSDFDSQSAVVYGDFLNGNEADALVHDIKQRMRRRRYEQNHWDSVIIGYKEVELLNNNNDENSLLLDPLSQSALERTRQHLQRWHLPPHATMLPCHAIDLKRGGELQAHVDSVRFSGGMVAGLSLLSSSIMRLVPSPDVGRDAEEGHVDLYLPPNSLYVLTGVSRFQYSHELLPSGAVFETKQGERIEVLRERRLSVIFRDAKIVKENTN